MKIKNLIRATKVAAVLLLAASCTNDNLLDDTNGRSQNDGEEVVVNFTYSVQTLSAGDGQPTRVVPEGLGGMDGTDLPIKNMFIIQFSGNESTSTMVGAPRFLDGDDLAESSPSVPLIQNSNSCYTLFVANIPEGRNYNWNMSTQSTFADVVKRIKTIASEDDAYVTIDGVKTLLVSAVTDASVEFGTPLEPEFKRNVAKLTLDLTLENAAMTIKSVRLCNVATGIVYADDALDNGLSGVADDFATIDYPAVTTGLPGSGATGTFSWYVPRNERGVKSASTGATDKTFYAPDGATYFEIVAVKTGVLTETSIYRVYPGANETDDFNILANCHYTIKLTVEDIGDGADSRVESFKNVSYADDPKGQTANSFILNPAPAGGGPRTYDIPIDQVNRYWNSSSSTIGYGSDQAKMIGAGDSWTVSLIWSDLAGLFGDSSASIYFADNNDLGYGKGTGSDQCFRLVVPAGMADGNFTLGIKKDGDTNYLWSWHFWVTGYNPDKFNTSVITEGVYTYPVPGGQVERYGAPASGTDLWGTAYTGKVMMDRTLGMVSENYRKQMANNMRGILHYQFGRKDPFPAVDNSNLNLQGGGNIVIRTPGASITIKESVAIPNTFIPIASPGPYIWTAEATETMYMWGDPEAGGVAAMAPKSIYDPCPPGWRLPADGTWNDFNRQIDGTYANVQNVLRGLGYNYGRGFGSALSNINGLRYWPGSSMTAPVNGTVWCPAAGYRYTNTGSLGYVGSNGYYWSSTPYSSTGGRSLSFGSTSVGPSGSNYRAYGFSVRCVAE